MTRDKERKDRRKSKVAYETTRRLLGLIEEAREGITHSTASIMKRFGIARAAAGRYLEFIEQYAGLRARVRNGTKIVQRVPSSEEPFARAAALDLAVTTLSWLQGTAYHKQLQKMATEARSHVEAAQHDALDRLFARMFVKRREGVRPKHYAQMVQQLSYAIQHRKQARLEYTRLDGATNTYLIEPWSFTLMNEALSVFGRKLPQGESRSFEISHLSRCQVTDVSFPSPHPSESDPAQIFKHSIGTYASDQKEPQSIELRVRGPARSLLHRRPAHSTQHIDHTDDPDWSRVKFTAILCPELTALVLSLLPDVQVIGPSSLRADVRAAAQAVNGSEWDPPDPSGIQAKQDGSR